MSLATDRFNLFYLEVVKPIFTAKSSKTKPNLFFLKQHISDLALVSGEFAILKNSLIRGYSSFYT